MKTTLQPEVDEIGKMFRRDGQRTSTVLVSLETEGERHFTFMVRPSADLFMRTDCLPSFAQGEGQHLCSIALSAEPSRGAALHA
ncbi:aminoimidazole riboside kinase, partial [Erwinia amylovora]|nr:aminoimidazole riboside kinase [Erwinia amylovora]